jgi:outer membrane immunogenic protein
MSVMKYVRAGSLTLGLMLTVEVASAADIYGGYKDQPGPSPSYPVWQGFYAGAHIGRSWATVDAADNTLFLGDNSGGVIDSRSVQSKGLLGGIQAGYNFQPSNWLFGVEVDVGGIDNNGSHDLIDSLNPSRVLQVRSGAGWYGDITGRGGFVFGNTLFYGKAGIALFTGDVRSVDIFDNIQQNSGTFTGWTAGGGIEYLIDRNWSLKIEYMYFDLGNNGLSCCFGSSPTGHLDNSVSLNTVKAGLNFHLN